MKVQPGRQGGKTDETSYKVVSVFMSETSVRSKFSVNISPYGSLRYFGESRWYETDILRWVLQVECSSGTLPLLN